MKKKKKKRVWLGDGGNFRGARPSDDSPRDVLRAEIIIIIFIISTFLWTVRGRRRHAVASTATTIIRTILFLHARVIGPLAPLGRRANFREFLSRTCRQTIVVYLISVERYLDKKKKRIVVYFIY